jgi:hypothetical protein
MAVTALSIFHHSDGVVKEINQEKAIFIIEHDAVENLVWSAMATAFLFMVLGLILTIPVIIRTKVHRMKACSKRLLF